MSTCPLCDEQLPRGSKRTAKNAAKMFDEGHAIVTLFEKWAEEEEIPDRIRLAVGDMLDEGKTHVMMFHAYAHSPTAPNPHWADAGQWSRHAKDLIRNLGG